MYKFLLPDLTHPEISIHERLQNIDRMHTMILEQEDNINSVVDPIIKKELFVERLRAMTMNLDSFITPGDNDKIRDLIKWGYSQDIHYSIFHESLLDCYCFYADYYGIHEHMDDIIRYFNSVVSKKIPVHYPKIQPIDTAFLSKYIINNLYNEYKRSIGNVFQLMDTLDPNRKTIDVSKHINTTSMTAGIKSKVTINNRMDNIDMMKKLIPVCRQCDFAYLMDCIFIEEARVFCMTFFISDKLVKESKHNDYSTLIEYMKRHMGDRLHPMCYIVEYLSDGDLMEKLYDQVFDMILYHNAMNLKRAQPEKELDTDLLTDLTTECLLVKSDPIICHLMGKFRQHTINGIIG